MILTLPPEEEEVESFLELKKISRLDKTLTKNIWLQTMKVHTLRNWRALVRVLFNLLTFFSAPGMILTLPPEEEEVEQQQLLATKDTNGKVTHVIVKDQEKQPVWTKLEKYLLLLCT